MIRTAALLMTATVIALASPAAMAANQRGGKPASAAKKKGARTGTAPVRPVRRGAEHGAGSLAATRGRAPARAAEERPVAQRPQRRSARAAQQGQQYRTPLHAARAAQRRPGRMRRALIAVGVVAALGVGFVVGDAFGLNEVVSGWFDNIGGGGEVGPPDGWNSTPDGWSPGERPDWAPEPGQWPDWAPDHPGEGGGGGPPSFEEVQQQLDKMMGRTPTPTK